MIFRMISEEDQCWLLNHVNMAELEFYERYLRRNAMLKKQAKEKLNEPIKPAGVSVKPKRATSAKHRTTAPSGAVNLDVSSLHHDHPGTNVRTKPGKSPRASHPAEKSGGTLPGRQSRPKVLSKNSAQPLKSWLCVPTDAPFYIMQSKVIQFSMGLVEDADGCKTNMSLTTDNKALIKKMSDMRHNNGHFHIVFSE